MCEKERERERERERGVGEKGGTEKSAPVANIVQDPLHKTTMYVVDNGVPQWCTCLEELRVKLGGRTRLPVVVKSVASLAHAPDASHGVKHVFVNLTASFQPRPTPPRPLSHTLTHKHTHTRAHTCAHMRTYTHTHTRTHTDCNVRANPPPSYFARLTSRRALCRIVQAIQRASLGTSVRTITINIITIMKTITMMKTIRRWQRAPFPLTSDGKMCWFYNISKKGAYA